MLCRCLGSWCSVIASARQIFLLAFTFRSKKIVSKKMKNQLPAPLLGRGLWQPSPVNLPLDSLTRLAASETLAMSKGLSVWQEAR